MHNKLMSLIVWYFGVSLYSSFSVLSLAIFKERTFMKHLLLLNVVGCLVASKSKSFVSIMYFGASYNSET